MSVFGKLLACTTVLAAFLPAVPAASISLTSIFGESKIDFVVYDATACHMEESKDLPVWYVTTTGTCHSLADKFGRWGVAEKAWIPGANYKLLIYESEDDCESRTNFLESVYIERNCKSIGHRHDHSAASIMIQPFKGL